MKLKISYWYTNYRPTRSKSIPLIYWTPTQRHHQLQTRQRTRTNYCIPLDFWIGLSLNSVLRPTSPPTQYRLYGRRFPQVKRPNQLYQSTEGKGYHQTGNHTTTTTRKYSSQKHTSNTHTSRLTNDNRKTQKNRLWLIDWAWFYVCVNTI